ncbi:ATP-binding cassette domain-containing protein [Carnobacteriaceae bacterium zg-ZUI78]|nr:ATP-binding cassette domain-containing protein [Carnobacteriaceae bacterium zg-ZUI78]
MRTVFDTIFKYVNIFNISGGEKQRVALARGVLLSSKFLLLDEVNSMIDEQTTRDIRGYLSQRNVGFIEVAHKVSKEDKILYDKFIKVERIV